MTDNVVWYSVDGSEFRHEFSTTWELDAALCDIPGLEETDTARDHRYIAQECAADYHNDHGGWESRWPVQITLHATEDGPALSSFKVDREHEPVFYAAPVRP